jgi:hypothetical protein
MSGGVTSMDENVREGLQKVRDGIPILRAFKRAAMTGVVLPTGDNLDTFLPTYLYIAIVSLLEDALKEIVTANYPDVNLRTLRRHIDFLGARGRLKNPARLVTISCDRNAYAHKPRKYACWDDVEALLLAVEEELQRLGLL